MVLYIVLVSSIYKLIKPRRIFILKINHSNNLDI